MNIFFTGLILNIIAGILHIPIGPERYIKRLYRTAYAVIDGDFDSFARKIADTIILTAVIIFVFMIVWILSEIYTVIPFPFFREIISGILFCLTLRIGQQDNLHLIYLLRHKKRGYVVGFLRGNGMKKEKPIDADIASALISRRDYTVRLTACPVFYMCFGIIPAFIYKTVEIISRTQKNSAALVLYKILSFIPAVIFRAAVRISGFILKRRIISGNSVHALIESYTGMNTEKDFLNFSDVLNTEGLIYLASALFTAFMLTVSVLVRMFLYYYLMI